MKSSSSNKGGTGAGITDRDLMLYVDGELEGDRLADVHRLATDDSGARHKVAALRLGGEMLRARAEAQFSAADSIADAVMGRIAAGDLPELTDADAPPATANGAAGKVVPIGTKARGAGAPSEQRPAPANDNSRRIWALTAAAVAAAAAFMIWGKVDTGGPRPTDPIARTHAPVSPQSATAIEAPRPPQGVPSPDGDLELGVEIAAVDFGNGQGSIFYMPAAPGGAGQATAVVWLADDDSGGKP